MFVFVCLDAYMEIALKLLNATVSMDGKVDFVIHLNVLLVSMEYANHLRTVFVTLVGLDPHVMFACHYLVASMVNVGISPILANVKTAGKDICVINHIATIVCMEPVNITPVVIVAFVNQDGQAKAAIDACPIGSVQRQTSLA